MKMENVVTIRDDFDLQKILESGQCFRVRRDAAGTYRFIAGERVLQIAGICFIRIRTYGNQPFFLKCF